jgi:type II secretory pathway component PulM
MTVQELITRWEKLHLREKRFIALGLLAMMLLIVYALIWAPIANKAASLRNQIEKDGKLLAWMRSADKRVQSLEKHLKPSGTSSKSLLGLIQDEINQTFAKNVSALRQADSESIQLNLTHVSFDEMIKWLIQVWQKQGLQITRMNVVPASETGLVNAEMVIKR